MELLENGLQLKNYTNIGQNLNLMTPLFSVRTVSLALSQSCRSVDTDAWCKRALNINRQE